MAAYARGDRVRIVAGPLRGFVGEITGVFLASAPREFAIREDPGAVNVIMYQVECPKEASRGTRSGLVFEAWLERAS